MIGLTRTVTVLTAEETKLKRRIMGFARPDRGKRALITDIDVSVGYDSEGRRVLRASGSGGFPTMQRVLLFAAGDDPSVVMVGLTPKTEEQWAFVLWTGASRAERMRANSKETAGMVAKLVGVKA